MVAKAGACELLCAGADPALADAEEEGNVKLFTFALPSGDSCSAVLRAWPVRLFQARSWGASGCREGDRLGDGKDVVAAAAVAAADDAADTDADAAAAALAAATTDAGVVVVEVVGGEGKELVSATEAEERGVLDEVLEREAELALAERVAAP
eukprot:4244991-Pleurochrysis_carterae.AAC.2